MPDFFYESFVINIIHLSILLMNMTIILIKNILPTIYSSSVTNGLNLVQHYKKKLLELFNSLSVKGGYFSRTKIDYILLRGPLGLRKD